MHHWLARKLPKPLIPKKYKRGEKIFKRIVLIALVSALFAGCTSIPIEADETTAEVKSFRPPTKGKSGLYIFRNDSVVFFFKKDIWVDGKCIGESAPDVFFYKEVEGDKEHKISTESEFSPNHLLLKTKAGMHYFIHQYMTIGFLFHGAKLSLVDEDKGKKAISRLQLAEEGTCSE